MIRPWMTVEGQEQFPADHEAGEVWQGVQVRIPPLRPDHSRICVNIIGLLSHFVQSHRLGQVFGSDCGSLLEVDAGALIGADVSEISRDRLLRIRNHRGYFQVLGVHAGTGTCD